MSNTNRSLPNALSGILEKLDGTIAKVTTLCQFLGSLESELREIREECENLQSQKRDREPILTGREQKSTIMKPEGNMRTKRLRSEPIPNPKSKEMKSNRKGGIPSGDSSLSVISEGSKSPLGRNWLSFTSILRSWSRTAVAPRHEEIPPVPQPPYPFPFPKDINPSYYPPELKQEGPGWFILFNPSPKVKRLLDVNLVHTPTHGPVSCVRFSQDGKWVATGSEMSAEVADVKTGVRICTLDHGSYVFVQSVCFRPDRKYLATGAEDKQVRVWNITSKQCEHILKGHQDTIYSVDFSPNGRFIVSGSVDGTVRIWDAHDWTSKVLTIDDHYLRASDWNGFFSVAISPDGRYVAAGSSDNVVRIWEMTTGVPVQRLRGHQNVVCSVAFTPDGKGLISGSRDEMLKYWDVSRLGASTALTSALNTSTISSSRCLMNLTGHTCILSTSVSRDGAWIVSGSQDGRVLFWDIRTGVVQFMLLGHKDGVYRVDLSATGNLLATSSLDGMVRIWNYGVIE